MSDQAWKDMEFKCGDTIEWIRVNKIQDKTDVTCMEKKIADFAGGTSSDKIRITTSKGALISLARLYYAEKDDEPINVELIKASAESKIMFNKDTIPEELSNDVSVWLKKAIQIAERFVNLPSAKKAYVDDFNVHLNALIQHASRIGFVFATPSKRGQALAWIFKTQLNCIYLNDIFKTRLIRLSLNCGESVCASGNSRKLALKEVKNIVFAMSMCIVHEFAHIAFELKDRSPQLTGEPKTPTTSKNAVAFDIQVTPEVFKEAGRYMERQLFFNKTLGIVCKPGNKAFNKKAPPQWSADMTIVGICQDKCPHDKYICEQCETSGKNKDHCLNANHSFPKCENCKSDQRYRLINKHFIERVFDSISLMTDDELQNKENIETIDTFNNDHVTYSISQNEDDHDDEDDDEDDDLRIKDDNFIISSCGTI